ncbi:MAG TPA: UvrD-helicase domain-containing protein [Tepidiformaceae bacterium]|nr:UvrD-helicase domain-containing protein [Tepidiformaceae bacterium]
MPDPTPEQRAVLTHRAGDIVVTAGAGSGKTHVLVERYLGLLEEHPANRLAAITFTDAAATELRERVRKGVAALPNSDEALRAFESALIGTMHAVCLRILRDHPVEAGFDPAFEVLPADEADFELAEACADAIEAAAEAGDARADAILEIGDWGVESTLAPMVADRHTVSLAFNAMGQGTVEDWMEAAQEKVEAHTHAALEHSGVIPLMRRLFELREQGCRHKNGDPLANEIARLQDRVGSALTSPAELLIRLQRPGRSNESFFEDLSLRARSPAAWDGNTFAEAKQAIQDLRRIGKDLLKDASPWTRDDELAIKALWGLRPLFEDACARYTARKVARRGVDFLDIELRAVELLRTHPDIAREYSSNLRELMVDEFQDTNALQCELVDLLTGRATGDPNRCRLFIVGDAKQAIYGFRGSDIAQFDRYRGALVASGAAETNLTTSFRTHEALTGHLNHLFTETFAKYAPGIPMTPMRGRGSSLPPGPHLSVLRIEAPPGGPDADTTLQKRYEAMVIAREIAQILAQRTPVWDRIAQEYRPARPSDIAVLLRRFTKVHVIEQALEARHITYNTLQGNGFFARQEVFDLVNLLAWLADPDDQIALFGVLRSPLFAIDDATLAQVRANNAYDLLTCLATPPADLPGDLAARCAAATTTLRDLRTLASTAPVDTLLLEALSRTGFEAAWAAVPGGEQAVANIRKLTDLARTLSDRSLDEFVEYIGLRVDAEVREAQAVTADRDAVRIMTIHGAKGLEFPIVFVPEANMASRAEYQPVHWDPEHGLAATLEKPVSTEGRIQTALYRLIEHSERTGGDAEYWRLFYVACTRAADYLFITGIPPKTSYTPNWLIATLDAFGEDPPAGVRIPPPEPADADQLVQLSARPIPPPDESTEIDILAPLVARPPVIPIRTSTPVTALREDDAAHRAFAHGDGLAVLRGTAAHRAIELRYGRGIEPDILEICRDLRESALPEASMQRLATDVSAFLETFSRTPLAASLTRAEAYFETPFAYNWDGVPIHGTLDLAYRLDGNWHVVDFKTDYLRGSTAETARPYLAQLGLYGRALERATGERPRLSLLFLRTGEEHMLDWADVDAALARVRERIDAGVELDLTGEPVFEEALS